MSGNQQYTATLVRGIIIFSNAWLLSCQPRLYVSRNGQDFPDCGITKKHSCKSLYYTMDLAHDNSVIAIDGSDSRYLYEACSATPTLRNKPLTITGVSGPPRLGCGSHTEANHILRYDGGNVTINLFISNVIIQNGRLTFGNINVQFANATLYNTAIWNTPDCSTLALTMAGSRIERGPVWDGNESPVGSRGYINSYILCRHLTVRIFDTSVEDANIQLDATVYGEVEVSKSIFSKKIKKETGIGGLNVTLPHEHGRIAVTDCIFEKLIHYEPMYSAINIEAAALRIESQRTGSNYTKAQVRITNSIFRENERAVSISRKFMRIAISDCHFRDNAVMHAAAALRIAVQENITVHISNCTFINNEAGYNRHSAVHGKFDFDGDQVQIHSDQINGILSLVGKGGAVRVHRATVEFYDCVFMNNTARLLGGAIFVDYKARILLVRTKFTNSDSHRFAMQGDILYSSGSVTMVDTNFDVKTASNHVSVIRHGGIHWSMTVTQISFRCPVGHRLDMVNTTSHRIKHDSGIYRSHRLDQLYYYCQTCGNNEYSVDRGSIKYAVTSKESEYLTLVINGMELLDSHPAIFEYGNITCRECPYGADCSDSIRAVANFWGYVTKSQATFQHCPPGYCCSSTKCPSINACADRREGELCGKCSQGYSEALFSTRCLPNYQCTESPWILPLTLMMGFIYALFLIFQGDLKDYLAGMTFDLGSIKCPTIRSGSEKKRNSRDCATANMDEVDRLVRNGMTYHITQQNVPKSTDSCSETHKIEGGCLIILFYYFQDALLLNINTIYTRTVSDFQRRLKAFLVGLFRFRLDFYQFMDDVCVYPNMQPVSKLLLKSLFVPYVLLLFGVLYAMFRIYRVIRVGVAANQNAGYNVNLGQRLSCRLAGGCVLAFLFTYQKLATAIFTLLNCVPLADYSVLYIDGTNVCFNTWQYFVMAYAFTCIIPFSFILMLGPFLIKKRTISLSGFFLGCLFPLPAIIFWIAKHLRHNTEENGIALSKEAETVVQILQGPFKDSNSTKLTGQLCWAGVLVGRRLILFLCFTFINDVLVRLLCMMIVCFVILMHHMYVKPYKTTKSNMAGAFSAAALLIVCAINLLRASFEAAEYIPQGPYVLLMLICEEVENTMVLWLPLAGVCLILVAIIVRLLALLMRHMFLSKHREYSSSKEHIQSHRLSSHTIAL